VNTVLGPGKSDGPRSMDPLGSWHVRGLVTRNRHGLSRLGVATVAAVRQLGSHQSIRLRSVNFWSGKLRCSEPKNW
jgi:hypothetical protein